MKKTTPLKSYLAGMATLFLTVLIMASGLERSHAAEYPTNGLVSYWKLDETTGTVAADASGNSRDGTLVGFPADNSHWITGYTNGGLFIDTGFEGNLDSTQYVQSAGFPVMTSTTFAVWCRINLTNANGNGAVIGANIGAGAGHNLAFDSSGTKPRILWNNGVGTTTLVSPDDVDANWNHLALTYDAPSTSLSLYVNGVLKDSSTNASGSPFSNINLGMRGNMRFPYLGDVDEVFIYDRALSPTEVGILAGKPVGPPELVSAPESLVVWEGDNALFSVLATGIEPISYQWHKDGSPLPGETSAELLIANAQSSDTGAYEVGITNSEGGVVAEAMLFVRPQTNIPPSVPSWVPSTGLVLYWNVDDTSDFAAWDFSGNQHHGALVKFPFDGSQQVQGLIDEGLQINEQTAETAVVVSGLPILSNFTWAAWVRVLNASGNMAVMSATHAGASQGHSFGFSSGANVRHPRALWNHGVASTSLVSPLAVDWDWNHLALTYDAEAETMRMYLNGVEVASSEAVSSTPFSSINLGRREASESQPLRGVVDEVLVYDRVLPPSEVASLYDGSIENGIPPFNTVQLQIEDIQIEDASTVDLTLRTSWPSQPHIIEGREPTEEAWSEIADVSYAGIQADYIQALITNLSSPSLLLRARVNPPSPLLTEDFESGASGWTHGGANDSWELGTPTSGPGAAHGGANVYATSLAGNYLPQSDCWLRSPVIMLGGIEQANLQFYEYRDVFPDERFHYVSVSILDANTLEEVQEVFKAAGTTDGWWARNVTLHPDTFGSSTNVILEFRLTSDPFDTRPGWYIDDISITPE